MDQHALSDEIDRLEHVQAELAKIASRADDGRRHDLIQIHRRQATQIAEVGHLAHLLLSTHGDADMLKTYYRKFSQMRAAAAIHQADWPTVSLGVEQNEKYRASAAAVVEADRQFISWIRVAIGEIGRVPR